MDQAKSMSIQEAQALIDTMQSLCINAGVQLSAASDDEPIVLSFVNEVGVVQYLYHHGLGQT